MTLTNPREALADQSNFIGYLLGLSGMARAVRELAADDNRRTDAPRDADDFLHALLGIASLGELIERLGESTPAQQNPIAEAPVSTMTRWLR
ncbi:hypothetical protein [Mycobacterium sp. AZCC_0083]|uniref:hypothetical protein n=1 Tax=Mycobacterium sp. AZCC_0083 TaxID=2735882 RepID=UPI0016194A68|nr:hypothetical protein [Mycobacterium sp. AZCC_0083]MBB5164466.1 hypothetical protein [Mycobacterium sp. AZCC_0083]